jgi:hypothetical protein
MAVAGAERSSEALGFLLRSKEPAVRALARRELLGEPAEEDEAAILGGPKVAALLAGQDQDSFRPGSGWRADPRARFGFGVNAYRKWTGPTGDSSPPWSWGFRRANRGPSLPPSRCSAGCPGRSGSRGSPSSTDWLGAVPPRRAMAWPSAADSAWPATSGFGF